MNFASLGPEQSGSRLAEQDSIANFVKLSQGQVLQAQAQQEQLKAAQAQKEMEAISRLSTPDGKGGPAAGGSLADLPAYWGQQLFAQGAPAAGTKLLSEAAKIRAEEASATARQAQAAENQAQTAGLMLDRVGALAGSANDEMSWRAAGLQFAALPPEIRGNLPNPFRGPYDPRRAAAIQGQALSMKDRLRAQVDAKKADSSIAEDEARIQFLRSRAQQHWAKLAEDGRHNKEMEKIGGSRDARGGKPVGDPDKGEIESARNLVAQELQGLSIESIDDIADYVASEASAMSARQRIPLDQARRRVLAEALKDQTIQVERNMLSKDRAAIVAGGRTADDPIEVHEGMTYVPGRYYRGPRGVARRTADGRWELIGQ